MLRLLDPLFFFAVVSIIVIYFVSLSDACSVLLIFASFLRFLASSCSFKKASNSASSADFSVVFAF